MQTLKQVAIVVMLSAATAALGCGAYMAVTVARSIDRASGAISLSAMAIPFEIGQLRHDVMTRVDALTPTVQTIPGLVDRHADRIEHLADSRMSAIQQDADAKLDALTAKLGEATGAVADLREDVRPVLAEAQETLSQASATVAVLRPQLLGSIAAFKVTMGESAETARDVRRAVPGFITTWDRIGKNSDASTQATAEMMTNLARATRPLPSWLRIPLSITGAVAPTAAGVLTGAAATGAFR